MKYLNVFLLLAIVCISNANSFSFSSLKEVQELKSTVFGSNLIETISMTFQNNPRANAGREVLAQLNELKTQLNTDQKNDTDLFKKKETAFSDHIDALNKEISELSAEIIKLAAEIMRLTNLINTANENIESFKARIENLQDLLENMAEANKQDNEYYNQQIENLGRLYSAFTNIISRLSEMIGSSAGKNIYGHIAQTEAEKRDIEYRKTHPNAFVEKKEEKKFMSFLQVVAKATNTKEVMKLAKKATKFLQTGATLEADQAALHKLISILSGIQDETLVKKSNTIEHLKQINDTYAELKGNAEEEIKSNQASLKAQIANRDRYIEERQAAEEEKKNKEERRTLLQQELVMNVKLLGELRQTYQQEKAGRAEEIGVVDLLERIVEKRMLGK